MTQSTVNIEVDLSDIVGSADLKDIVGELVDYHSIEEVLDELVDRDDVTVLRRIAKKGDLELLAEELGEYFAGKKDGWTLANDFCEVLLDLVPESSQQAAPQLKPDIKDPSTEAARILGLPKKLVVKQVADGGGALRGYVTCQYSDLVKAFGDPNSTGDDHKVDVEWMLEIDGTPLTIYNWKNGPNFNHGIGNVRSIVNWNIGGESNATPHPSGRSPEERLVRQALTEAGVVLPVERW